MMQKCMLKFQPLQIFWPLTATVWDTIADYTRRHDNMVYNFMMIYIAVGGDIEL